METSSEIRPSGGLKKEEQTGVHIFGAFMLAMLLVLGMLMAPWLLGSRHRNQIEVAQASVQVDLKLIQDSEAQFFAKHGFYTTDLKALGIKPKKVLYKFGFTRESVTPANSDIVVHPRLKDLDQLRSDDKELEMDYSPLTHLASIDFVMLEKYCPDCTATDHSFKAIAAADFNGDGQKIGKLDLWLVDQTGQFTHLSDGLK